jgi:hypothetical protein
MARSLLMMDPRHPWRGVVSTSSTCFTKAACVRLGSARINNFRRLGRTSGPRHVQIHEGYPVTTEFIVVGYITSLISSNNGDWRWDTFSLRFGDTLHLKGRLISPLTKVYGCQFDLPLGADESSSLSFQSIVLSFIFGFILWLHCRLLGYPDFLEPA